MVILDDDGLQKLSYEENLTIAETYIKAEQGESVDLSPSGPWGQIAVMMAKYMTDLGDQEEDIYLSRDPDNTTGLSLDKLSAETGTTRKRATNTQVFGVLLEGSDGAFISKNKQVQMTPEFNPSPDLYFLINEDTYINKNTAKKVLLSLEDVITGLVYEVTVNSTLATHTAIVTDTKEIVCNALIAQLPEEVLGTYVPEDEQLQIFGPDDTFVISFNSNLSLETLWGSGDFTASITGQFSVPEDTLTEIVTPVTGWDSVSNPVAGVTGTLAESDDAFRIRRTQELVKGLATDSAIRAEVFSVENVSDVSVISNRALNVDIDGRPAKSFETIVAGGEEDDIAQAIFASMPSGIEPYGVGSEGTATDPVDGETYTIPFTRPQTTYIWVRYTRTSNPEETFPDDGVAQIKQSVVDWSVDNSSTGEDVLAQKLLTPFFEVPGSLSAAVELAETENPGDTPTWAVVPSIDIDGRTRAAYDVDRVFVLDA